MSAQVVPIREPIDRPVRTRKFASESFNSIQTKQGEEYLVKRLIPKQGLGVLYGESQSFKSFLALDLGMHVACGWDWAGRRVDQTPVIYVASEGAAGVRKRIVGLRKKNAGRLPTIVPFELIPVAPNLGTEKGDLGELTDDIEAIVDDLFSGTKPGLIFIDTLSQSLGGADENGPGMIKLISNATYLAKHFGALVIVIHHVGFQSKERPRGHSSLLPAADVQLLCHRPDERGFSTNIVVQKLKDGESNITLTARLSKIVTHMDDDGDEVTTLVVDTIEESLTGEVPAGGSKRELPAAASTCLSSLRMVIGTLGIVLPPSRMVPANTKAVTMDEWRGHAYKLGISDSSEERAMRTAFKRSFDRLIKEKKIYRWEDHVWLA